MVEENGARLNRDRLANAYLLAGSLAGRPGPQPRTQSQIRRWAGAVLEPVIQVLGMAEGPLRAREIHAVRDRGGRWGVRNISACDRDQLEVS